MVEITSREYQCGKTFCSETPISDEDKKHASIYTKMGKKLIMKQAEKDGEQVPMVYVAGDD